MAEYELTQQIIAHSVAKTWDEAKREWSLDHIYEASEPERCLCGHYPIIELCVLRNKLNGNVATVGNCCVKKFIGLPSDKIFQAIKRVRKREDAALNSEAISYAHDQRWINEWEQSFYSDTLRKRKLSEKQIAKRVQINKRVLARIAASKISPSTPRINFR